MEKQTNLQKRESEKTDVAERTHSGKVFSPPVDIYETKDDIVMIADMPGVAKDAIDINLEKGVLSIKGRVDSFTPDGFELTYAEYDVGDYERSFTLDDTIEQEKIEASYNNGVLTLRLPKAEKVKPKKIEVKVK